MKESAVYQEILQEGEQQGFLKGEQQGFLKGKLEIAQKLLAQGLSLAEVSRLTELSADTLKTLSEPCN